MKVSAHLSGRNGLRVFATEGRFRPSFMGFWQEKQGDQQVDTVERRRREKRRAHPDIAQETAENGSDDEPDAEGRLKQAEAFGANFLTGNIGDVGGRNRHVGAGDAGDRPAEDKKPQIGREGHDQIIDGRAAERDQKNRPPSIPITQHAEHRRKQELAGRIDGHHQSEQRGNLVGMPHIAQERRQDGKDEADTDGVERHSGQNDGECLVHIKLPRQPHASEAGRGAGAPAVFVFTRGHAGYEKRWRPIPVWPRFSSTNRIPFRRKAPYLL